MTIISMEPTSSWWLKFNTKSVKSFVHDNFGIILKQNTTLSDKNSIKRRSVSCFRWQLFQRNQHHDDGMMSTQKGTTSDLWPLLWVVLSFVLLLGGVVKGPSYIKKGLIQGGKEAIFPHKGATNWSFQFPAFVLGFLVIM